MTTAFALRKNAKPDQARVAACKHDGLYWYLAAHDECGWFCADCSWSPGEDPGYSPEYDRDHLRLKCWCILHEMADAGLVSVSNSGHGEGLASSAERIAREARTFDQQSIVAIIGKLCAGDGAFWRERHESILAGRDNRNRCHCGKLAHVWRGGGGQKGEHLCWDHASSEEPF